MKKILTIVFLIIIFFKPICAICSDLYDCALLYDPKNVQNSDINFQVLSNYYGLKCKLIDITAVTLTNALLKDENSKYFKAMSVNAGVLAASFDSTDLSTIKHLIDSLGVNLLISDLDNQSDMSSLGYLTNLAVVGAAVMNENNDWIITPNYPWVSLEFTGQTITYNGNNSAYSLTTTNSTNTIILSKDNDSTPLPTFVMVQSKRGKIFVNGCIQNYNLEDYQMMRLYTPNLFHVLVPTMMFIRYSTGNECWHHNHNYANLTIDDPDFSEPYGYLNYNQLLFEMETHNFHTTIAFKPANYGNAHDTSVLNLFLNYPDRYSIVQHGNNHDGYEFVCYTQDQLDTLNARYNNTWYNQTPRSFYAQEADIVEGKTRLHELEKITGIPYGDIVVFPWGIGLSPTLALLKAYNYNATVNGQYQPYLFLEGDDNSNYDFNMRPANMNFGNFAVIGRLGSSSWNNEQFIVKFTEKWLFNLFIDKPLLLYTHYDYFQNGMDHFNPYANFVNNLYEEVNWIPLGESVKKMYLEKTNDDGSISVQFYGNNIIFSNETDESHLYHFLKEEWFNIPIIDVQINGMPTYFENEDSTLSFDIEISPNTSKEILLTYSSGDKDFAINNSDITIDSLSKTIFIEVHNYGNDGGPCPLQIFNGKPDSGYSLDLMTIERIEPFSKVTIELFLPTEFQGIYVKLDPHNIVLESNESNNEAFISIEIPTYTIIDNFEYDDSPLNHKWTIHEGEGDVNTFYDTSINSRVMQVITNDSTGFRLDYPESYDLTVKRELLSFKMKASNYFKLYVRVHASDGNDYYLQYTPDDGDISYLNHYIKVPIGSIYQDGTWHKIERNLDTDIYFGIGKYLDHVKYFAIRGSYYFDDLILEDENPTSVEETSNKNMTPNDLKLVQNYPNPFNYMTTVNYSLSEAGYVTIIIYDSLGRKVKTLVNQKQSEGYYKELWDGKDERGADVSSGVYFYRMKYQGNNLTRKMLFLK